MHDLYTDMHCAVYKNTLGLLKAVLFNKLFRLLHKFRDYVLFLNFYNIIIITIMHGFACMILHTESNE